MPQPTPTDLAWAAGFFDGEGCLSIYRHPGATRANGVPLHSRHRPLLTITQVDRAPLDRLAGWFGGRVYTQGARGRRVIYQWSITGARILEVLSALKPYLIVKRAHAELMAEYLRGPGRAAPPGVRLDPKVVAARTQLAVTLSGLNGR